MGFVVFAVWVLWLVVATAESPNITIVWGWFIVANLWTALWWLSFR